MRWVVVSIRKRGKIAIILRRGEGGRPQLRLRTWVGFRGGHQARFRFVVVAPIDRPDDRSRLLVVCVHAIQSRHPDDEKAGRLYMYIFWFGTREETTQSRHTIVEIK